MYFYIEFYSGDEFEEESDYGHIEASSEMDAESIFYRMYPDGEIVTIHHDEDANGYTMTLN